MDQMEVLPSGLAHDSWIALVVVDVGCNVLPQLLKHKGRAGEVQCSEIGMGDALGDDFWRRTWNELDDAGW